jgi:transcriptional regulator with XRE-family HTH domain
VVRLLTFGKWLKAKRLALKLTQEETAKRAGLTRPMWAKLEADESGTRRGNIPRIAAALEADITETYERAGFSSPDPIEADVKLGVHLHRILRDLPPEKRERIETMLLQNAEQLKSLVEAA